MKSKHMSFYTQPADRQFRWLSSTTGDPAVLAALNDRMAWFYGQMDGRSSYQEMLEGIESSPESEESNDGQWLPDYICSLQPQSILEVGCSSGRLYRQLRGQGYAQAYTGIEVADYLIQHNQQRHPEATWKCAGAYEIPFEDGQFDVCFSTYVLEHLVYPERALEEMLRVIRPGGRLVLVFPDFVVSGRLASQQMGWSPVPRASEKLKSGRLGDALLSLFDSRVRMRRALKSIRQRVGPFPINVAPICLSYPEVMGADVDAVYIASKQEVADWARARGYSVDYPYGVEGFFELHSFLVIHI
jgi:SAM-dependent methyltransferase